MSGLDAFIPQPQDPADLPAALRKFAEWVEQQKTAMEATVRAEVAKVDQATITANVLAQVPATIAPFKIESFGGTGDTVRRFSLPIPEGAVALKIIARGGPSIAAGEHGIGFCFTGQWEHAVIDLRNIDHGREPRFNVELGDDHGNVEPDRHAHVSFQYTDRAALPQPIPVLWAPGAKDAGSPGAPDATGRGMVSNDTEAGEALVASKAIFEWFKTPLPGAVSIPGN